VYVALFGSTLLPNSAILTTVTLASTSNTLPDDGVIALKHVGAVLMSILM
jgi:hypothetical protein